MNRLCILLDHLNPKNPHSNSESDFIHLSSCSANVQKVSTPKKTHVSSDYLRFHDLLSEKEKDIQIKIRTYLQQQLKPVIIQHVENNTFPMKVLQNMKSLVPGGSFLKGYGCAGLSFMEFAMSVVECAKIDGSFATVFLVHSGIGMAAIGLCGSEEQKKKWLPLLSRYEKIAAFALTEPDQGSDASNIQTTATRCEGGWLLNGTKRWIGNIGFENSVAVVWAKNTETNQINGFIIERGHPGFEVHIIPNKIAARCVPNSDIHLKNCFVPESQRLANATNFQNGPGKVLFISRLFAAWAPIGIAQGAYEAALDYSKERKQFGKPIAAFQLTQNKLFTMLSNIQCMFLLAFRATQLLDNNQLTHGMSSMVKATNTKLGREVVSLAREIVGGNGIIRDYNVATSFCDMEAIYTYEGTYDINVLITGREVTGMNSIK